MSVHLWVHFFCPTPLTPQRRNLSHSLLTSSFQVRHHHHHFPATRPPSTEAACHQTNLLETLLFFISPLLINLLWFPIINGIKQKHLSLILPGLLLSCDESQPSSKCGGKCRPRFLVTVLSSCPGSLTFLSVSAGPSPQLTGNMTGSELNQWPRVSVAYVTSTLENSQKGYILY